jgi:hypothetical protein
MDNDYHRGELIPFPQPERQQHKRRSRAPRCYNGKRFLPHRSEKKAMECAAKSQFKLARRDARRAKRWREAVARRERQRRHEHAAFHRKRELQKRQARLLAKTPKLHVPDWQI